MARFWNNFHQIRSYSKVCNKNVDIKEEFEDIKGAIRIRKSMKNREFEDTKGAIRIRKSMKNSEFEDTKGTIRIRKSMKNSEFEDTKGVIRIRKSMKNRQHNGQKKKYKRTNSDLQNIHIKLKIE